MTGAGACYGGTPVRVDDVMLGAKCQWSPKYFEKGYLAGFGIQM